MHPILKSLVIAPALLALAACNKDKPADPSLNTDLGLAAQANSAAPLDSITAAERARAGTASATAAAPATVAPAPRKTATTTTRRATTTRRSTSSGSTASSSGSVAAPAPREEIHKNTKRDAAIGAGAGAIIGGVVAKGGVKGAVIGGAAGAILGGVIGNNVDVQKKKVP
jgi:outer membrane lipoprotein SlyB